MVIIKNKGRCVIFIKVSSNYLYLKKDLFIIYLLLVRLEILTFHPIFRRDINSFIIFHIWSDSTIFPQGILVRITT